MKRWLLPVSILLLLLLAFFSWGLYFLLWTPGGVHWLLGKLEQYASVKIQVARVHGRLAGDLVLEGVQVRWEGGRLAAKRFQSSLEPLHLLQGKVLLRKFVVGGIAWEAEEIPPRPVDLTLPRLPSWLGRLDVEIEALRLEAIRYRYNRDPPIDIPGISGRLAWKQGMLAVNPLKLDFTSGRLEGSLGLGLWAPSLHLEAFFTPAAPLAGMDRLYLQARLKQGRFPAQMAGALTVTGRAGSAERLAVQAQAAVGPHRIDLTRASIRVPGRKGTAAGRGAIIFVAEGTRYRADLQLAEADLSPELKLPVRLSGDFFFEGTPSNYSGRFELKNNPSSWQKFQIAGDYQGDDSGMEVALERGDWLKGVIKGRVALGWQEDFTLRGSLSGRDLRPEVLNPRTPGLVNLDLEGGWRWSGKGRPQGDVNIRLLDSEFQKRSLKGLLLADWQDGRLTVQRAELQGRGFTLAAGGVLDERLNFEVRIADLTPLLPEGRGSGSARGWVRWRNKKWTGQVTGQGRNLSWEKVQAGSLDLAAGLDSEKTDTAMELRARIKRGVYQDIPVNSLDLRIDGSLIRQDIRVALEAPPGRIEGVLQGGYATKVWRGNLVTLAGTVPAGRPFRLISPTELVVSPDRLRIYPLVLTGEGEERLTLEADVGFDPLSGFLRLAVQRLNADRARSWLTSWKPEGSLDGRLQVRFSAGDLQEVRTRADLQGQFQVGRQAVAVERAGGQLDWDARGLRSFWEIELSGGETLTGRADSSEKPRLAVPSRGMFRSSVQGVKLENWSGALPAGLGLRGLAGGRLQGQWSADKSWNLTGGLQVSGGALSWKNKGTDLQARLSRADLELRWQEETLRGRLAAELEKVGRAAGAFSLPLPARWPIKMQPSGAVSATLTGKMQENGLVTALFPQTVRASRGKLDWDLGVGGAWEKPLLSGTFSLSEAGADLPPLGIRLQEVSVRGGFREDRVHVESLVLRSGPGLLNGRGEFRLKNWRITALEGRLTGKNFQFINRPDLQGLANPELEFSGTPDQPQVKGQIEIPEALISAGSARGVKRASSDVVIVDAPQARTPGRPFPLRGELDLLFGEKVRIKVEGLNTLLKGKVRVALANSQELKAEGEIRADQGHYLVQGSKLEITRGRLFFRGPPDNPALDLLALRTIRGSQRLEDRVDEVRAGVVVTGTVRSPLVRLYSQPAMSDSDVLSYILFGKPLGRGTDRTDLALLGKAARSLLGEKTESTLLSRLDLDSLDIQTGGGDFSRSMVTVGKYLDPRLYLGLGGALFSNTYQVILRYALTPRLELETKGGTQSGGGIFFKVDFE